MENNLSKPDSLMLQNATPLRNHRPDLRTCLMEMSLVLAPATWNADLFKHPTPATVFQRVTKPSRFANFFEFAESDQNPSKSIAPATNMTVERPNGPNVLYVLLAFWFGNALRATSKNAPSMKSHESHEVSLTMCFAPQRRALSTSQLPKIVRTLGAFNIFPESASEGFFVKKAAVVIHLHTLTSADLHLHTFTSADLHLHTFTSADVHLHTFTSADLHPHTFTSADLHLHTFTSADLHPHTFTSADLHLHTFTSADLHLHTFTSADLHPHTFTSADLHLHTFTSADLHPHTFTSADLHLHTFTSADLHLHTFTSADLHPHTFTSADLHLHTFTSADLLLRTFTSSLALLSISLLRRGRCRRSATKRNPFARNGRWTSKT